MDRLTFSFVALMAAACFAIVFKTPRRYFIHTVALGMLSGVGIHLFPPHVHVGFSTFTVALVVGCLSHLLARATGKPAQAFIIPSVMFLVPGAYLYRGFSQAMAKDYTMMGESFLTAISITLAISFGLLLANWVVPAKRAL
jgi:uncharacterized membrane protein YjjB (DUF3815 family)